MRRVGFTLIELLVVVAVIALLAAIIVPVLQASRQQARTVLCSSNQRQVSLCFSLYQQEKGVFPYGFNDDGLGTTMVPPPGDYPGSGGDKDGWWWFHYLQDVSDISLEKGSALWCPARDAAGFRSNRNILCGNYGVNRSVCRDALGVTSCSFSGEPLRAAQIRRPSATILIADSGYSLLSWMAAVDTGSAPFENPMRIASFYVPGLALNQTRAELVGNVDAIKGRHPHGTINLGFVDGHIEHREAEFLADGISYTAPDDVELPLLWKP